MAEQLTKQVTEQLTKQLTKQLTWNLNLMKQVLIRTKWVVVNNAFGHHLHLVNDSVPSRFKRCKTKAPKLLGRPFTAQASPSTYHTQNVLAFWSMMFVFFFFLFFFFFFFFFLFFPCFSFFFFYFLFFLFILLYFFLISVYFFLFLFLCFFVFFFGFIFLKYGYWPRPLAYQATFWFCWLYIHFS